MHVRASPLTPGQRDVALARNPTLRQRPYFKAAYGARNRHDDRMEIRCGILGIESDKPIRIGSFSVSESGQENAVDECRNRRRRRGDGLNNFDDISISDRINRSTSRRQEALIAGISRVRFAELPAVRLRDEVIEMRFVDVVPQKPTHFPWIWRVLPTQLLLCVKRGLDGQIAFDIDGPRRMRPTDQPGMRFVPRNLTPSGVSPAPGHRTGGRPSSNHSRDKRTSICEREARHLRSGFQAREEPRCQKSRKG